MGLPLARSRASLRFSLTRQNTHPAKHRRRRRHRAGVSPRRRSPPARVIPGIQKAPGRSRSLKTKKPGKVPRPFPALFLTANS
jgi:hypothetical protein